MPEKRYRDFNTYLREKFGCRVQKVTVDAGLTCPNRDGTVGYGGCIYCNPRGSGTGASFKKMTISEQIAHYKSYLGKRYKAEKFLVYFQSFTNTYASLPVLKKLYNQALDFEDVVGLSIGTRPDCVPDPVLDYLQHLSNGHLIWLEYGLQSAHDRTLQKINRGHSLATFVQAVEKTQARGLPICAHIIIGLPGESAQDIMATARFLARLRVEAVKIHLLYVVKGTTLNQWYQAGQYSCLSRQDYVSLVAEFLSYLPPEMIIQRLTGDPHRDELIAPAWALENQRNLQCIQEEMQRKDLYQGKWFQG